MLNAWVTTVHLNLSGCQWYSTFSPAHWQAPCLSHLSLKHLSFTNAGWQAQPQDQIVQYHPANKFSEINVMRLRGCHFVAFHSAGLVNSHDQSDSGGAKCRCYVEHVGIYYILTWSWLVLSVAPAGRQAIHTSPRQISWLLAGLAIKAGVDSLSLSLNATRWPHVGFNDECGATQDSVSTSIACGRRGWMMNVFWGSDWGREDWDSRGMVCDCRMDEQHPVKLKHWGCLRSCLASGSERTLGVKSHRSTTDYRHPWLSLSFHSNAPCVSLIQIRRPGA